MRMVKEDKARISRFPVTLVFFAFRVNVHFPRLDSFVNFNYELAACFQVFSSQNWKMKTGKRYSLVRFIETSNAKKI